MNSTGKNRMKTRGEKNRGDVHTHTHTHTHNHLLKSPLRTNISTNGLLRLKPNAHSSVKERCFRAASRMSPREPTRIKYTALLRALVRF